MDAASDSLLGLLDEQIRCASAMLATLDRERDALVAGDHEALDAARADKDRLVAELEELERRRRELTDRVRDGLSGGDREPGADRFDALLGLLARCRDENRLNGALLRARRERVGLALRLLRGAAPDSYGPEGRTPLAAAGRPLGSA